MKCRCDSYEFSQDELEMGSVCPKCHFNPHYDSGPFTETEIDDTPIVSEVKKEKKYVFGPDGFTLSG